MWHGAGIVLNAAAAEASACSWRVSFSAASPPNLFTYFFRILRIPS